MPVIEELNAIRRSGGRISVVIDGQSAGWITEEVMLEKGVAAGMELSYGEISALMQESMLRAAKAAAFNYISYKRCSEKQLRDYLLRKEYDEESAEAAVELLRGYGYIDDEQLSGDIKQELLHTGRLGTRAINQKLRQRGLPAVEESPEDEETLRENALYHAGKAWKRFAGREARARRAAISAALARKGFGWDEISYAIRMIEEENQQEERNE